MSSLEDMRFGQGLQPFLGETPEEFKERIRLIYLEKE